MFQKATSVRFGTPAMRSAADGAHEIQMGKAKEEGTMASCEEGGGGAASKHNELEPAEPAVGGKRTPTGVDDADQIRGEEAKPRCEDVRLAQDILRSISSSPKERQKPSLQRTTLQY